MKRIQFTCGLLAAGVLLALALSTSTFAGTGSPPADRMLTNGMTRAEFVSLYQDLVAVQYQPPACVAGQEMFDDVPASHPFCPWIEELSRRGITVGCGNGNYCPDAPATRDQLAAFAVRSMEACPTLDPTDEMVRVGGVCIDKYEASIWDAPVGGNQIMDETPIPCNANGQDCDNIYARSVAGVRPASGITWAQALAALANSGKRLPTNAEWQMAVRGTPDGSPCNVDLGERVPTGSFPGCVSDWGAFDMVGNVWEWVADWVPRSTTCGAWPEGDSDDQQCLAGAAEIGAPGALIRGGNNVSGAAEAGPFAVFGARTPVEPVEGLGFRGAR